MAPPHNPVIVRQSSAQRWTKPGLHAYSTRRRFYAVRDRISRLSILQLCLAALGLAGIGYYTFTLVDQYVYQSFQNWAFEEGIAGRSNVTFSDYLRQQTLLAFLTQPRRPAATAEAVSVPPLPVAATADAAPAAAVPVRPARGAVLGRLAIERLHLSAMVREGVDDKTLRVAVGHVPSTALAGQAGNFAIAAHRDTLFRALKDIRNNDLITFQLPDGVAYQYRVAATQIVKPSDVNVLRADGGGLIRDGGSTQGMPRLLTMITCYPFTYVGSAPKRFIVEAKMVEAEEAAKPATPSSVPDQLTESAPTLSEGKEVQPASQTVVPAVTHKKRVSPRSRRFSSRQAARTAPSPAMPVKPLKKKGFWRKIFGNG